ncbi:hypothetical protein RUM43_001522 [Polyplax serrata]|uniref:Uncharacterized protein n=1 Tax=Polyplax serrata TaxID=468196 RepID=A0AAN8SGD3_POLSC
MVRVKKITKSLNISVVSRSIITKKGDGSQVKESTDSSTTLEDDDVKDTTSFILYPTYLSNSVKNIKGLLNGVTIH